jgi:hypothetical protein
MTKQTAVECLYERLERMIPRTALYNMDKKIYFEQAKAMEKEQIEDAYEIGFADAWDDAKYDDEPKYAGSEQYYNQTYGGDK